MIFSSRYDIYHNLQSTMRFYIIRYTCIIFWKTFKGTEWFWWHLVSVLFTWIELIELETKYINYTIYVCDWTSVYGLQILDRVNQRCIKKISSIYWNSANSSLQTLEVNKVLYYNYCNNGELQKCSKNPVLNRFFDGFFSFTLNMR